MSSSSAADGLGRARAALESTDDATLQALAEQIGEALTVVADAGRELGDYLDELPADASALDAKLARQAQLRTLTRKYAADIDGVLRWAPNLATGWRNSTSPKRDWPAWNGAPMNSHVN